MNAISSSPLPARSSSVDPLPSHPTLEPDERAWAEDGELGEARVISEAPPDAAAQVAAVVATHRRERHYVSEEAYY